MTEFQELENNFKELQHAHYKEKRYEFENAISNKLHLVYHDS